MEVVKDFIERSSSFKRSLLLPALFLLLDLIFLRWVWIHFPNWGIWDWDYQQTLFEVTRSSWITHHQVPLWNLYIGGGVTLAGNTLNHAWAPSFLPVLVLGTIPGIKVCILLYLILAQGGMYLLAKRYDLDRDSAFLSALLFSIGGVFAQRLTHGHFEWIAIAWIPFILWALLKNSDRIEKRSIALGSLFLAFVFLDGGPYQFAFLIVFLVFYTAVYCFRSKNIRLLVALAFLLLLGGGLASIKLLPVYETVNRFPRTVSENNFYDAPSRFGTMELLTQSFVSREQGHDPEVWMPFRLNVGCYLGWIPLLLAMIAILFEPRKNWPLIVLLLLFAWTMLGSVLPFSPWDAIHTLPGLSMLRVPARFNIFVALLVALLAGSGLQWLKNRWADHRGFRWMPVILIAVTAVDLNWINGEVFKPAFSIPPIKVKAEKDFKSYLTSPFMGDYRASVLYPLFDNWPSAAYPAVLQNRGVIANYRTIEFESFAYHFLYPHYLGEAWIPDRGGKVVKVDITPNRITVTTNGIGEHLIINQNYDPGWKCSSDTRGTVMNQDGLLMVRMDRGTTTATVLYRPDAFRKGCYITLLSLLLLIGLFVSRKNKSPP